MTAQAPAGYIASHGEQFVAEFRRLCQFPSHEGDEAGLLGCLDFLQESMARRGIETRRLQTRHHAALYGEIRGVSPRALLFYSHYDTVPPGPLEAWDSPPFAAVVQNGRIVGRGVSDHKGSVMARIQAVEALRHAGDLPITVKFLVEGDEELGSPDLLATVTDHADLLLSDGCLYSGWFKDAAGRPQFNAGSRGTVSVRLTCTVANQDLHARNTTIVPDPVWRLIWALATIKTSDERIHIDGFFGDAEDPSAEDWEALRRIPFSAERLRERLGVRGLIDSADGVEAVRRMVFTPGIAAGDIGLGGAGATHLGRATATLRFHMVPNQRGEVLVDLLRQHLDRYGFGDVDLEIVGPIGRPARVPLTTPVVQAVVEAAREVYEHEPVIYPISPGSGPRWMFIDVLGTPVVSDAPISHVASNDHGPNENIFMRDYLEGIQHIGALIRRF